MKRILGLALGLTMIALTPAVGNAAGMVEITCGKEKPFFIKSIGGKQNLWGEQFEISFVENQIIVKSIKPNSDNFSINHADGKIYANGKDLGMPCKFKNLELIKQALLNQNKKPVSTSVQQRLQALEERMDRLESSLKK